MLLKLLIEENKSFNSIRYGMHFMFASNNRFYKNHFYDNSTGVAVMFSKNIQVKENLFERSRDGSSYGVLVKDITDSEFTNNTFQDNTIGVAADNSTRNKFLSNRFLRSGGQGNNGGSGSGSGFGGGGDGGAGGGTGTDYSLSGRSLLGKKVPFNNSQKSGKIVVQIKVGKDGNVLFAQGPYKGSTSTDAYLVKISEEAAYKFKFSANNDAAEEQFGTITFNYTFN